MQPQYCEFHQLFTDGACQGGNVLTVDAIRQRIRDLEWVLDQSQAPDSLPTLALLAEKAALDVLAAGLA